MAFRNNNRRNNNNNNHQGGGNFNNNYGGGGMMNRNVNPWMDNGNMGGGGGGGRNNNNNNHNNNNNNDALALANNLLSNLLRNQNQNNAPPSLLDMAGGGGHRNGGYNDGPRGGYNDFRMNRGGNGGRMGGNNRPNNNNNRNNNRVVKGAIRKPNGGGNRKPKNSNNSKKNDSAIDQSAIIKKNDDARNATEVKEDQTQVNEGKRKNSPYAEVPNEMFYCHLCTKHMWDSTSFENHLKGRTHQMMKEGVEESYRLRANMLRQDAKIAEQLKSIEIDRLKRLGKTIRAANQIREYCAMCDLHFYGHLSTHRKSDGHLELKKFLHPKCDECSTEFHNRTEFDDHLLSPGHMKIAKIPPSYKSEESRRNRLNILTESEETQGLREEKPKKEKKEGEVKEGEEPKEGETAEVKEGETAAAGNGSGENETKEGEDMEDENQNDQPEVEPILDFKDGDEIGAEIESKIPKYNCKRQVGMSMISKLVCFECRLCNKYFDSDITSEIHARTFNHHRMFVKFLNEKANETKIAQKRAAAAAAEEDERQKRIKLDTDAVAEAKPAEQDLYDPSEATGDDDMKDADEKVEEKSEDAKPEIETPAPVAAATEENVAEESKETPKEETSAPAVQSTPTPAPAPAVVASPQPQQQQQQQNNTPNRGSPGNRGGRGRKNNNQRRYGGRY